MRPCARVQTKGSPYCWQHTVFLREVAKCLNTTRGDSLDDELLDHLTVQREDAKNDKTIPAMHALEGLENSGKSPSLGALEQPVEIVQNIISQLSLPDLRNFKAVNSRARSMVVSSYQYRNVITYGSEVISALYKTELHSIFPLIRIHEVLTQDRCVACDRFGGYAFLQGFNGAANVVPVMTLSLYPLGLVPPRRNIRL